MKRWIDRWNAYWFPTTTSRNLSLARIIAVFAQLFVFRSSLHYHINLLEKNSEFIAPQALVRVISTIVPRDVLFTPSGFTALYWVTIVAGVLALVGLFTRTSLFIFALGTWIFIAHKYSYSDIHHPEAVFAIFLMVLAFAPSGHSFSIDALLRKRAQGMARSTDQPELIETAAWPLKLAHVLLAMTYFSTGATKLIFGGFQWMNGYTLQSYVFGDAIRRELPLGIWLGQHHNLAIVLSVFTILLETFFFLSLFLPLLAPLFFVSAFFFQIGLLLSAGHSFYSHMLLLILLLLFLEPEWWRAWIKKYQEGYLRSVAPSAAAPKLVAGE